MVRYRHLRVIYLISIFISGFVFGFYYTNYSSNNWNVKLKEFNSNIYYQEVDRFSPIIFVGGWPRSGTTLMRILLDVNEEVRCGPETRVIPKILEMHHQILQQKAALKRSAVNVTNLDAATTAFILEIIRRNGEPAKRLCNKDPMTFIYLPILGNLFPNAKFVCMVRDGRAVVHSIFKRGIKISNVDNRDPWNILKHWNIGVRAMHDDCIQLGYSRCIIIKYENIILQPKKWVKFITDFLNIPEDKKMYKHWKYLKSENVLMNSFERSTDQVVKPLSQKAIHDWMIDRALSKDFITTAHLKAETLKVLEYDITKLPPEYGIAEVITD